ncbi:MAG TPA: phosphatase PAP2 family protein [Ferruginibacter sp.]|nr:phosphatase PAP2 family protein [Ferruginibacter sp.]
MPRKLQYCLLICMSYVASVNGQSSRNDFTRPRAFSFITNIPRDVAGFTKNSFQKKHLPDLLAIVGSTGILLYADQSIINSIQDISEDNNISSVEKFSPIVNVNIAGKRTNIGKLPKNLNTALYYIGQGSTTMFMAAGFYLVGKIKKDNRALQTASQLTESFITLGIGTQIMKYSTGRENPSDATVSGGRWQPFPGFRNFQNNKPKYDAFPSGHLSCFVSAVTIIGNNYPEKKWIKPVGYGIAGLCSLAMLNNGVHWASDYPLAIGLGHGFGRFIQVNRHSGHSSFDKTF